MDETTSLDKLYKLSMTEVENLEISDLKKILDDINSLSDKVILAKQWINVAIARKYKDVITVSVFKDSDTERVTKFIDRRYQVTQIQKKRVKWDQEQLKKIAENIIAAGDQPEVFMEITYSVPESKYMSWGDLQRTPFKDARCIFFEQPTFSIKVMQPK